MSEKEEIKINEPKEDNNKETQIAEEKPDIKNELTKKLDIEIPKEKEKSYIKFLDNKLDKLFYDIKYYSLSVIQVDIYGNSIPLGAFCFAIAFILIGFKDCKVNKDIDEFFYYIILFFGCFGQLIAGILEYIKGRTLPANLYLLYGVYFLSYFYFYHSDSNEDLLSGLKAFYYGSWAVLSFPIFIGSVQSNVFFLVQTLVAFAFFVLTRPQAIPSFTSFLFRALAKQMTSSCCPRRTGSSRSTRSTPFPCCKNSADNISSMICNLLFPERKTIMPVRI